MSRMRATAIVSASAALGLLLGAGGTTWALWSDDASISGEIGTGYEYFAAGLAGATTAAVDHEATVTIGSDAAQTLLTDHEVAIPLQTDSLSQGNKGLHYTITQPDWNTGIFGASTVGIFPIDSAAGCAVENKPAEYDRDLASTPVTSDYSTSTTNTVELWCLVAELDKDGISGEYTNTATVRANDPDDVVVTDTDEWNADVRLGLDPDDEPDHDIIFTYSTFRPGVTP